MTTPARLPLLTLVAACLATAATPAPTLISSPNQHIVVSLETKELLEPYPTGQRLYYRVSFDGHPLLLDSPFRLDFQNAPPLARGLRITARRRRTIDEIWETRFGTRRHSRYQANEITLALQETAAPNRKFNFVVRVSDDGVAFRYELPEQPNLREFQLAAERTEFHFTANHTIWAADYGGFLSHQESEFKKTRLSQIRSGDIIGCPVLVDAGPAWMALTEADLTDWAGMYFTAADTAPNALMTILSPNPESPEVAVVSKAPRHSPWRVVLIGERPGDLIESNLIPNLNDPSVIADTSWIKPGVSAWDRWWPGGYAPDFPGKLGMSTASMKYFVDFASEMGWQYQLVDWTWYGEPFDLSKPTGLAGNPNADLGKSIPELDLPELVRYAKAKNVAIWVWLEWDNANKQMERVFPLYEKWGIAGVKVDFMQRDDQWMVNFYERLTRLAAQHHLMVDFHGAYKPTGAERTYPNLLTREGVMGNEYNKWSDRITPTHTVTLPFTRMLAGPMDFTPGGFRHKTQKTFRAVGGDTPGPFVMGTRAHQLAMSVVYFSPLQVMCDSPYNYRMSPAGLDFLKSIPTAWDETRVIAGYPGEFVVIARRAGTQWYIGGMNGDTARSVKIPLQFLPPGDFQATLWSDADEVAEYPERIIKQQLAVNASSQLTAAMASGGGYVVHIAKAGTN